MRKLLPIFHVLCLFSFSLFFLASTHETAGDIVLDPVPGSIEKSGLELRLFPIATIPYSTLSVPKARINLLKQKPGPTGDLMVCDLRGKMYRIDTLRQVHEYLDLDARSNFFIDEPGKGTGFGAFAFHPEFESNGLFYTAHAESPNGIPDFSPNASPSILMHWVVTQWTANNPLAGTFAGSRKELMRFAYPGAIHGLQDLTFNPLAQPGDPDYGLLYLCLGEGQCSLKGLGPANLGKPDSYLGSIFRIDPLGDNSANGKYGIPADNPFVGQQSKGQEIWAYGFRNPHRLCFARRNNAAGYVLLVGDIGEKNIEEINLVEAGQNYGWNEREGTFLFDPADRDHVYELPANDSGFTYPVAMYDHDEGNAVVSGYLFGANQPTALQGQLLLGDIVNGRLFHVPADSLIQGRQFGIKEFEVFLENVSSPTSIVALTLGTRGDIRFGYDKRGGIYLTTKGDGKVYSIGPYRNPISGITTSLSPHVEADFELKKMGNSLEIIGASPGSRYRIVAIDGREVAEGIISYARPTRVSLHGLRVGLYVMRVEKDGKSSHIKFLR